ncbi:SNF2 family N-terminal domain-containing protein [Lipomyces tetrasporus]|uniref:SNF2 family N-terminal domain-containing protein n=1 Tax=Lipomyces tetrasporus TaxID=54092 RepID=A0AAD7VQQ8_9ASCO|nr:SNF2 family N-terminal domain-containing protein [Lipomyces tetrasporus]KAJ8098393.1 SNF2 family N-terminal domain-containing protein [Lipomyces tetrasporus]
MSAPPQAVPPAQPGAPPQNSVQMAVNGFHPTQMPIPTTREGVQQLLMRWQALKAQGADEVSNPEFANISKVLRLISKQQEIYKQQRLHQQQQQQAQQQGQPQSHPQSLPAGVQAGPQQIAQPNAVQQQAQLQLQMQQLQFRQQQAQQAQPPAQSIAPAQSPQTALNGGLPFNPALQSQATPKPASRSGSAAGGGQSVATAGNNPFTAEQLQMLRTQITAFKLISKNMVIPPQLQQQLFAPLRQHQQQQQQQQQLGRQPSFTPPPNGNSMVVRPTSAGSAAVPPLPGQAPAGQVVPPEPPAVKAMPTTAAPIPPPTTAPSQTPPAPALAAAAPKASASAAGAKYEIVSPYLQVQQPIQYMDFVSRQNRLLIPSIMPSGVDIIALKEARETAIKNRVATRITELENLPANIAAFDAKDLSSEVFRDVVLSEEKKESNDTKMEVDSEVKTEEEKEEPQFKVVEKVDSFAREDRLKVRALIELKGLRMLAKQREMRSQVLKSIAHFNTLAMTASRSNFRRLKKQSLREARLTEQLEKQQRAEREKRERQRNLDYLVGVCNHGTEMLNNGRVKRNKHQRLGKAVLAYHAYTEREEQRRAERTAKQRLQALKANDEEAYMKLLDQTKDTRITHLLRQTNSFLDSLAQAVKDQQRQNQAEGRIAPAEEEVELDEDGEEKLDYYGVAHRIHEIVTRQPAILVGGTLKEYQVKGLQWMVSLYNNNLNGILADEMGLGKTIQTISLITYLVEEKQQSGPYLVIVPLSTLTNWNLEFEKWAPTIRKVVYKGPPLARKAQQAAIRSGDFQVLLTTYEYIIKDRPILSRIKWIHMIIDEGHRMKNSQSKLSSTLTQFYHSRYRLILTGTPLQNNLPELWALLNFVLPKIFNSVKSFDEWFNTPFANTGGQDKMELSEEETLLIIRRLHKVLRPFLLRRLKKDVEKDLPDKVEKVIKCKMSALQHKLYEQMLKHNVLFVGSSTTGGGNKSGIKGLNNQIMQLRKICNHPFVFEEIENLINPNRLTNDDLWRTAGKFELLDRMLPKFKATGHRVLMFFQMTQIMDIMEDFMRWRGMEYLRLDGGTKSEDRSDLLKKFNAPDSPYFAFLLSTRAGGLGLNLQTADTVIIYDTDWNPHQDLQAQDRAHRIGQTKEVRIFRLITEDSVEEMILERAHKKLDIDGKVIQAGKFDNKSTAEEQEAFLRSLLEAEEAKKQKREEDDEDLDDEELNELLARDDHEAIVFKKMDADRIANSPYGKGKAKDRLYTDNELPEIYKRDMIVEMREIEEAAGRGVRKRKVTRYDDGLTEKQWLDAIDNEEDTIEDAIERSQKKDKKRGKKRKTA